MLWRHNLKLPSTIFYFITDWHHSLTFRLYPITHSLKQTHLPQKCFFSRKPEKLSVPMQSTVQKDHGHKLLADRVQKTLNYISLDPFFSKQLRLVGEKIQFQSSQGIASQVFDEDFDVEYAIVPADDELHLKKGKRRPPNQNRYSLVDVYWAKAIVKKLKKVINFHDDNIVIVECNPDYGLLTHALLLRTKVEVLCIHYRKCSLHSELESLMKKRSFKKRLHVERGHIINIRMMLKRIGKLHGKNAKHVKIIGTTFTQSYHSRFITLLSYDLGELNHIYSLGHIDIFLFVPEHELQILGKTGCDTLFNKGSLRSALYKVFFNVNVLLKIPSEAFKVSGSGSHHYLIHLVPRPDLYEMCSPQHIPHLIMLLKELRKRRGQKVITGIQSFCTPTASALKELGFTDDDNISDLTVEQIIKIHQVILSRPDCLPLDLHDVETSAIHLP